MPDPTGPLYAIATHLVRPGVMETAVDRLNVNGGRMASLEGFISRELLINRGNDSELMTITKWVGVDQYEAWVELNRSTSGGSTGESPYVEPPVMRLWVPYPS